jgi:hypothetical protein
MPQMSSPPSLGDVEKPELMLTRFEVPLPSTRREIVAAFESILNQGGVQKVVVEVKRPIQVSKFVDKNGMEAPVDAPQDDFWNQVRNGRMEEFRAGTTNPYELVFNAFSSMTTRKLRPKILYYHNETQLRAWLGLSELFPIDFAFGIETAKQADIPEDAVVLAGTGLDETDPTNTLGIRIPVEVRAYERTDKEDLGVRTSRRDNDSDHGEVGIRTRRFCRASQASGTKRRYERPAHSIRRRYWGRGRQASTSEGDGSRSESATVANLGHDQ